MAVYDLMQQRTIRFQRPQPLLGCGLTWCAIGGPEHFDHSKALELLRYLIVAGYLYRPVVSGLSRRSGDSVHNNLYIRCVKRSRTPWPLVIFTAHCGVGGVIAMHQAEYPRFLYYLFVHRSRNTKHMRGLGLPIKEGIPVHISHSCYVHYPHPNSS